MQVCPPIFISRMRAEQTEWNRLQRSTLPLSWTRPRTIFSISLILCLHRTRKIDNEFNHVQSFIIMIPGMVVKTMIACSLPEERMMLFSRLLCSDVDLLARPTRRRSRPLLPQRQRIHRRSPTLSNQLTRRPYSNHRTIHRRPKRNAN